LVLEKSEYEFVVFYMDMVYSLLLVDLETNM